MRQLAPDATDREHDDLVRAYKEAYRQQRLAKGSQVSSPLYPGARDLLETLHARPEFLLGVATGKSRRGLDGLLDGHELKGYFVTQQVADHHPSKPHPSMLKTAMS
jgi:phosphoglycolate phosphatase